jgi:cation transport regulator ChaB
MPKTTKKGDAKQSELPDTLKRSPKKAQRTFAKAHDSAAEEYGEGRRAHQTAFSAVKHSFEKVGDHWEPKGKKGPSDKQAAKGGAGKKRQYATAEGVDANASKKHLLDVAKRLDISGRWAMRKNELVEAIKKVNRRESAGSRKKG